MKLALLKWIIEGFINKNNNLGKNFNSLTNGLNSQNTVIENKEKKVIPSIVNINVDILFDLFNFFKEQLYTDKTNDEIEQIIKDINEEKQVKLHYLIKLNYITGEISYWDTINKKFMYGIYYDISLKQPITNKDFPCDWDNKFLWQNNLCPHFRIHEGGLENLLVPEYISSKRNFINLETSLSVVESLINYKFYDDSISKIVLDDNLCHTEFMKSQNDFTWQKFSTISYDEYYEKFVKNYRHPQYETSFRISDGKYFCNSFSINYFYSPLNFDNRSIFLEKYGLPL